METIAERFKYLRNLAGMNQVEFAQIIQLSQGRLSDIERGKNKPSADTLISVVKHFNISADWLLDGTGDPPQTLSPPGSGASGDAFEHSLDDSEKELLREFRLLNSSSRSQLLQFIDYLRYIQNKGSVSTERLE